MRFLVVLVVFFSTLFASQNTTVSQKSLTSQINAIDARLKDNIWVERYENYNTYKKILNELERTKQNLTSAADSVTLRARVESLQEQLELLKEFEKRLFLRF